jgi:hypothetical protein
MAVARVVSFEGVDSDRMRDVQSQIEQDPRPENVPASEIVILHDADAQKAVVILFFESEEDYRKGDQALNAMAAEDTPGRRSSVQKFQVAGRMSA